ncbi:MAG: glycoside hydrolase family 3 protein [Steroidobacteraceae bacterium]
MVLGLVVGSPLLSGVDLAAQSTATVHPAVWPQRPPALPPDPVLEARISSLLGDMTLEQKVGQLIQADIGSLTPDDLRHYPLGSILNGGSSSPDNNEFAPPSEWLTLADRFYDASMDPLHGAHPIPTMWGTDAVHGHNNVVGATIFPHNIGLGAAHDPELIRQIGEVTAREVRVTGMDWTFGPTLAVVRDDRWGRTYESYSEDPQIVREYAAQMVLGLQGSPGTPQFLDSTHVIATAKHFVGDGGTGGRDQGDNRASEIELRDIHFAGYPPALGAGVQAVMASFSSWQGLKMHGNHELLTDVLKQRLHFDGLVVGDWNGHGQVPGCTNISCAAAINAGVDVIMAPDSWKQLYANTVAQVRSGEIPMPRIEDADRRILRVKLRAHLLDEGRPSSRPLAGNFELLGAPEHRAIARRAVRESLVLLKNANHLLPLKPAQHVLVAGDGANSIGKQSGGWTITWQGTGVTNMNFPHAESIFAGILTAVQAAGGSAELNATGNYKTRPDVAIVVFGENPYAEFQGDIGSLEYNPGDRSDLELLRRLHGQGVPVVAIFLSGRPLWVNSHINASDAFVAAWLPGAEGGGIADVIFRAPDGSVPHDFHGKLSFSWPLTPQQTAVNRGDGVKPLFAYGYGLTYAANGNLRKLAEGGSTPVSAVTDSKVFFAAGKPGSGWDWTVSEDAHSTAVPSGVGVVGSVRMSATDRTVQEDARQIRWNAKAATSVGLASKAPINLQRETNGQLSVGFDYRVDQAPTSNVVLQMQCGPDCKGAVDLTKTFANTTRAGEWSHVKVPLACFANTGARMEAITQPFELSSTGQFAVSVANVRLESGADALISCTP